MSTPEQTSARLPFRVEPLPLESPRGYLCRVAQVYRYYGPRSLAAIAGVPPSGLDRRDRARHMAHVLRLEPEQWLAMCYRPVKGRGPYDQRLFYGEPLSVDHLNYRRPRICPSCLQARPVWWAVWDLALVTACPIHRCVLLNQCPACQKRLVWHRPSVQECRCGLDLRALPAERAGDELVAINAAIYRASGFPPGEAAEECLSQFGFPPEMLSLRLGPLLRLVQFFGSVGGTETLQPKQRRLPSTNLGATTAIAETAVAALRDWPRPLREVLRRMIPHETCDPAALRFSSIFGNFYRHLFRVLPRSEFGFLRAVFESFVIEDWRGFVRGQHRFFSAATRRNSQWITADQAEKMAHTTTERLICLVRSGDLEGTFNQRGRTSECWIRRESLSRWIASRDAELARYMGRPEAKRALGLTNGTIVRVAAAGLIRYVEGPGHNFPGGCFYFLREDVMKIKAAFERHAAPAKKYSRAGEFIALRHGMKNYLGHDSGLVAVIRAVVDGNLLPIGYTERFRGITGYLFRSTDLRKYRPVPDVKLPPEGFLNYTEAAALLQVGNDAITALVAHGFFTAPVGYRSGLSKLLSAVEVQSFADRYVATSALAKSLGLCHRSGWINCYLRHTGTPVLAVPMAGKGTAGFVLKEAAARIRVPSGPLPRIPKRKHG